MTDLVEFLRARLAEDEEAARLATQGPWRAEPYNTLDAESPADYFVGASGATVGIFPADYDGPVNARHAARHDPARVLAEVEAKRGIVGTYAEVADMDTDDAEPEFAYGRAVGLGIAVRQMATPYAAHPDYRPEWAPTS